MYEEAVVGRELAANNHLFALAGVETTVERVHRRRSGQMLRAHIYREKDNQLNVNKKLTCPEQILRERRGQCNLYRGQ